MAFRLGNNASNSPRKLQTDALADSVDVGSTNPSARLLIYTGSQPATPATSATGVLLATIPFNSTAFTASDNDGTAGLTGGTAISATIVATGTAGYARITDRDNRAIMDMAVGTNDTELIFDNVAFTSGGTATIASFSIQTPM